jgi:hypothetical protein
MLFKKHFLGPIARSEITLAFRRWRRPTVKAGGSIRTAAGVLYIERVDEIDPRTITDQDARHAGYESIQEIAVDLASRSSGAVYRIKFRLAGADPREELRRAIPQSDKQLHAAVAEVIEADRRRGWFLPTIQLIADKPATVAASLARMAGLETAVFKRRVRVLKELGLTESLGVGYRLSPRGRAIFDELKRQR